MSRRTLVLIAALLLAVLAMTLTFILWSGSAERQAGDTDQQVIPFDEPGRWSREIAAGKHPVLVRAPVPAEAGKQVETGELEPKVLFEGESLGQLEGVELQNLIKVAERQVQIDDKMVKEYQDKMDPSSPADIAEEASLLTYRELSLVTRNAILEGDYFVVSQETNGAIGIPPNSSKMTMPARKNGQPAIAIVIAADDDYPSLADAKQYRAAADRHALEQTVWDFNAQDYSARKALIDRYFEIRNKKDPSYEENEFLDSTVPTGAKINRSTLLLSIRE